MDTLKKIAAMTRVIPLKVLLLVPFLLIGVSLNGCAKNPGTGTGGDIITRIQDEALRLCSFVPTANTVAAIVATLSGVNLTGVTTVAMNICNAVTSVPRSAPGMRGAVRRPTYNGVVIEGRFVR